MNPYYHPRDDKDSNLAGWGEIRDEARDVRVVAHVVVGGEKRRLVSEPLLYSPLILHNESNRSTSSYRRIHPIIMDGYNYSRLNYGEILWMYRIKIIVCLDRSLIIICLKSLIFDDLLNAVPPTIFKINEAMGVGTHGFMGQNTKTEVIVIRVK